MCCAAARAGGAINEARKKKESQLRRSARNQLVVALPSGSTTTRRWQEERKKTTRRKNASPERAAGGGSHKTHSSAAVSPPSPATSGGRRHRSECPIRSPIRSVRPCPRARPLQERLLLVARRPPPFPTSCHRGQPSAESVVARPPVRPPALQSPAHPARPTRPTHSTHSTCATCARRTSPAPAPAPRGQKRLLCPLPPVVPVQKHREHLWRRGAVERWSGQQAAAGRLLVTAPQARAARDSLRKHPDWRWARSEDAKSHRCRNTTCTTGKTPEAKTFMEGGAAQCKTPHHPNHDAPHYEPRRPRHHLPEEGIGIGWGVAMIENQEIEKQQSTTDGCVCLSVSGHTSGRRQQRSSKGKAPAGSASRQRGMHSMVRANSRLCSVGVSARVRPHRQAVRAPRHLEQRGDEDRLDKP